MPRPLLSFVGDDFTGSTDALEVLELAGLPTVLFTAPPTQGQLARYADARAIGVATVARSLPPESMEPVLRRAFTAVRAAGAAFAHYKVCSTFDSSPTVGSIGRAMDVGAEVFGSGCVPVVVGAPSLGRYCAFGNLFVQNRGDAEAIRLDRHPSMSRHPVTPMDEADLRLHLARQSERSIGLFDLTRLAAPRQDQAVAFAEMRRRHGAVLIDLADERQLADVGALLAGATADGAPAFIVGSSGVESALCAHWREIGVLTENSSSAAREPARPVLVASGSCSPVSTAQVRWAVENGFGDVRVTADASCAASAATEAARMLEARRSVVVHTAGGHDSSSPDQRLGIVVGNVVRQALEHQRAPRVVVAGGDTSGAVAAALGVESMRMVAPLARGAPLVRVTAPGSPADGIEMVFKGGQVGAVDFFGLAREG